MIRLCVCIYLLRSPDLAVLEEGEPVEVASSAESVGPVEPASVEPEEPAAPLSGNHPQPSTASVYSPTASGKK